MLILKMAQTQKPSPDEVENYLNSKFPIARNKLIQKLVKEQVPRKIINIIEQVPDRDYKSKKDLIAALADLDPSLFQDLIDG